MKESEVKEVTNVIHKSLKALYALVKDRDKMVHIVAPKGSITEDNISTIRAVARRHLVGKKIEQFQKIHENLEICIDYLLREFDGWSRAEGTRIAHMYGLSSIEGESGGNWGLLKAIYRYEPTGSFTAYVKFWIRQVIQRELKNREYTTLHDTVGDSDTMSIDNIVGVEMDFEAYVDCMDQLARSRDPVVETRYSERVAIVR
jgi:hypothetical protein